MSWIAEINTNLEITYNITSQISHDTDHGVLFPKSVAEREVPWGLGRVFWGLLWGICVCMFMYSPCSSWSLPAKPFPGLRVHAPDQPLIHEVNAALTKSSKYQFEVFPLPRSSRFISKTEIHVA